ncbi:MAG: DEAD/DEAH box helicase, partial [Peptococcaceae bacterium]|nr:DEAD/DEAH box helicase [Peptococcaceae bacterium]
GEVYDLLFQPEINEWQGRRTVRALLKDIRESEAEQPHSGQLMPESHSGQPMLEPHSGQPVLEPHSRQPMPEPHSGQLMLEPHDWGAYRTAILGGNEYREKQTEALNSLASGKNTMLLMATGRGKTAVFQTAAAALNPEGVSIIVYPLRSLARDQFGRMERVLQPLGIRTALAWGGLDHWEKRVFFKELYQGRIRMVISTAEFLQAHLDKFSAVADRIGLFVVDEAHHLGDNHRQAYQDLRQTWKRLGSPLFLATTATADDACADRIKRDFAVETLVLEEHCRENLVLNDARGKDKEGKLAYLLDRITPEGKMIVYVNSRALTEEISRTLQDNLPLMKNKIGYYHGGLQGEARQYAENAFRSGEWNVLVSTSAFGEGTDIPDIRDVALYHLCFSRAEYNQLSGRAGRDGINATIHLLYGEKDVEVNRLLLREEAPDRDVLGSFYRLLREKAAVANPIALSDKEIAQEMALRGFSGFTERTAACCLGILEEIALLLREDETGRRDIHMAPPPPAKLDLMQSSLYMEGIRENALFDDYLDLAFTPDLSRLLAGINRPILPGAS